MMSHDESAMHYIMPGTHYIMQGMHYIILNGELHNAPEDSTHI
jgi:hypothetical protein